MADEKVERVYTVPLGKAYDYKRTNRVPRAVKLLRQFVSRHMKADIDSVLLSNALNNSLWTRSIQKPPRRVKVRVLKKEGIVNVYLPDEVTEEDKAKKKEAEDKAKKDAEEKAKKEAQEKAKNEAEEKAKKEAETKEKEKTLASAKKAANMPAEKSGHGGPLPESPGNREAARLAAESSKSEEKKESAPKQAQEKKIEEKK